MPLPYPSGEIVVGSFGTWNINSKVLGSGSFAVVKEAVNLHNGVKAVVKTCSFPFQPKPGDHQKLYVMRELTTLAHLSALQHPNIVSLYDAAFVGDTIHIFEEKVEGMELFDYLKLHKGRLPTSQVRHITTQLLSALHHMHTNHVLHRDIKLDNIIINPTNLHVTLIDFNLSSFFTEGKPLVEPVGCLNYSSPQILEAAYGEAYLPEQGWSDLWALGVAVYGMLVGFFPFRSEHARKLRREIATLQTTPLTWFSTSVDPLAQSFVESILSLESVGKISAQSLMDHPFVAGEGVAGVDSAVHPYGHLVAGNERLLSTDMEVQLQAAQDLLHSIVDIAKQTEPYLAPLPALNLTLRSPPSAASVSSESTVASAGSTGSDSSDATVDETVGVAVVGGETEGKRYGHKNIIGSLLERIKKQKTKR